MPQTHVNAALARLQSAADRYAAAFPRTHWTKIDGPGPDTLDLNGHGGFEGLVLEPGRDVALRCRLEVPEEVDGVRLAGDPLVATLGCLYPTEVVWNGAPVFQETGPPVAAGPALFTVLPSLQPGSNGALEFRIRVPNNQTTAWVAMRLTTPGLRARFQALDIAFAQLALAGALATTDAELAIVEGAAALVPDALPTDEGELEAILGRLAGALAPLQGHAEAIRVHVVGHSHIDMNWLWTWPDTLEVIKRDVRSVVNLMGEFPELTFSHSQPATYEVIREQDPALFERVLEYIRAGRWEPLTMTWVEGDVNMASGEGMARQLLQGVRWSREVLGVSPAVFHAPDTFGHAGNLPQLAASAGGRYYYHHRANPGQADQWPAYWWQGQDGSRLLGISTGSYNGEINARDLAAAAIRAHKWGQPCALHFHGIGDHGGGPSRQNLEALRVFQRTPLLPTSFCSTVGAYAKELLDSGVSLPGHEGESSTIFEGCYTTHADTKRYNRAGENLLMTADTLSALAGQNHNAELTPAWRAVLFNQFHDILDGSAIHETYEKNASDFSAAAAEAEKVTGAALAALHAGFEPGRVAVTNPLGFERQDWVEVPGLSGEGAAWLTGDHGHVTVGQYTAGGLGFVARVPAFGTVSYALGDVPAAAGARDEVTASPAFAPTDGRSAAPVANPDDAPYLRVDTPAYTAYVRRDCGVIVSFVDKRMGRDLVGYGMRHASDYMDTARPELALNVFQVTDELPHGMTAWQLHEVHSEQSLLRGATVSVVEQGPARCVLQVEHTVRKSSIRQRIVFYRDLPRIDFETYVDWQEVGNPEQGVPGLKAAFTAHLPECEAWFETPFAAVQRPADGLEVPVLRWLDVGGPSGGIAVLNDSKYGCDVLGCRARLTLLRSAYDPDAISDKGEHTIRYALLPHVGGWQDAGVVQAAAGFNQPLLARQAQGYTAAHAAERVRPLVAGAPTVQVACLKPAADGSGTVVRLYESGGRSARATVTGIPPADRVWETSIVEDSLRAVGPQGGRIELAFRPWQVRTLLIEHGESR